MFQFPGFPLLTVCIPVSVTSLPLAGFPHSDIKGSMPACGSPLLFAACHVLLRRLVPWHPPCALLRLITSILRLRYKSFRSIDFPFCNWSFKTFFLVSLSVQLSRCAVKLPSPFRISLQNPENDTDEEVGSQFLGHSGFSPFMPFPSPFRASRFSGCLFYAVPCAIDLGLKAFLSIGLAP